MSLEGGPATFEGRVIERDGAASPGHDEAFLAGLIVESRRVLMVMRRIVRVEPFEPEGDEVHVERSRTLDVDIVLALPIAAVRQVDAAPVAAQLRGGASRVVALAAGDHQAGEGAAADDMESQPALEFMCQNRLLEFRVGDCDDAFVRARDAG